MRHCFIFVWLEDTNRHLGIGQVWIALSTVIQVIGMLTDLDTSLGRHLWSNCLVVFTVLLCKSQESLLLVVGPSAALLVIHFISSVGSTTQFLRTTQNLFLLLLRFEISFASSVCLEDPLDGAFETQILGRKSSTFQRESVWSLGELGLRRSGDWGQKVWWKLWFLFLSLHNLVPLAQLTDDLALKDLDGRLGCPGCLADLQKWHGHLVVWHKGGLEGFKLLYVLSSLFLHLLRGWLIINHCFRLSYIANIEHTDLTRLNQRWAKRWSRWFVRKFLCGKKLPKRSRFNCLTNFGTGTDLILL